MTERVSTLVSVLIHAALLALLSFVSFRQLHKPEEPAGMELEIIDAEHAMPLPDPAVSAQEAAPAAAETVEALAEPLPPSMDIQRPTTMPPVPQPPTPQAPQPVKVQPAPQAVPVPRPARPAEVAQLGVGPVAPLQKPSPPAPRVAAAPALAVPRPAAEVARASTPAPAPAALPSAPPRPRIDAGSLARAIAARAQQTTQTRISSATLGSAIGRAAPRGATGLTVRQRTNLEDMIRSQITPCWNPPVADDATSRVTVVMRIQLDRGGAVVGSPAVSRIKGETPTNAPYTRALSGSVRRAILRCAPLKLPPELFEAWSDVELNFDPRDVT